MLFQAGYKNLVETSGGIQKLIRNLSIKIYWNEVRQVCVRQSNGINCQIHGSCELCLYFLVSAQQY